MYQCQNSKLRDRKILKTYVLGKHAKDELNIKR